MQIQVGECVNRNKYNKQVSSDRTQEGISFVTGV